MTHPREDHIATYLHADYPTVTTAKDMLDALAEGGGGTDLSAIGNFTEEIASWGVPGFQYGDDDSAGWVALQAGPSSSEVTAGYGTLGANYAQFYVTSTNSVMQLGEPVTGSNKISFTVIEGGTSVEVKACTAQTTGMFYCVSSLGANTLLVSGDNKIGFFDAAPAAKPTGVAVTAGGIHAALVTLGLIAA